MLHWLGFKTREEFEGKGMRKNPKNKNKNNNNNNNNKKFYNNNVFGKFPNTITRKHFAFAGRMRIWEFLFALTHECH